MPFIRITILSSPLSPDQVRRLQSGTTALMGSILKKKTPLTAVLVEQVSSGGWSIGNEAASIAAQVEATITAGTNSDAEKAAFIREEMRLLKEVLGKELREETYVVIREIPAVNWGYGGFTQEERHKRQEAA